MRRWDEERERQYWEDWHREQKRKDEALQRQLAGELPPEAHGSTAELTRVIVRAGPVGEPVSMSEIRRLVEQEGAVPGYCETSPDACPFGSGPVTSAARYLRNDTLDYLLDLAPERAPAALGIALNKLPHPPTDAIGNKVTRMVVSLAKAGAPVTHETTSRLSEAGYMNVLSALRANGIQVHPPLLLVSDKTDIVPGEQGARYTASLRASGGDGRGYTWSVPAGELPAGLALGSSTGKITGVPAESGKFNFTAAVTTRDGQSASVALQLEIVPKDAAKSYYADLDQNASSRLADAMIAAGIIEASEADTVAVIDGYMTPETRERLATYFAQRPMSYGMFFASLNDDEKASLPSPVSVAANGSRGSRLFSRGTFPLDTTITWLKNNER